jgi:hypothetical protein
LLDRDVLQRTRWRLLSGALNDHNGDGINNKG